MSCRGKKIGEHADELARLLTQEQGKPLNGMGSRFELGGVQAWTHHTADIPMPVKVLQDNNEGRIELHRKPIGVVGSITPWNWPVADRDRGTSSRPSRVGNTVVNKPSPYTPLSTLRMVEIMNEVLPPGVVNCITGPDAFGAAMLGASRHRQDRLHRLGPHRQESDGRAPRDLEAADAGAWRQRCRHRAAGRRS